MLRKHIYITISVTFLLIVLSILLFGRFFPSKINTAENRKSPSNYLNISNDIYYRQTLNNCAPYSVMAVINILRNETIDPELLSKEIKWRIYKNLTFPQGMIDLLHEYKIKTKEYVLYNYSDTQKTNWLKTCIDNKTPVILLVEIKHIKHYFTIIGYDSNGFMIYDSLQEKNKDNAKKTITDNIKYVGNRYYTNDYVMKLWNDGGYKIFFRNWAVVSSL